MPSSWLMATSCCWSTPVRRRSGTQDSPACPPLQYATRPLGCRHDPDLDRPCFSPAKTGYHSSPTQCPTVLWVQFQRSFSGRNAPMLQFARRARVWPGAAYPLGATFDGRGVNFALFSANAEKVELCLFDARGQRELERVVLPEYTDQVWHGYLPDARPGPALRLPRLRALRPESGPSLQSSQAAARPLCQAADRPAPLERRPFRLPGRRAARGPRLRHPRQCARHAQMPGGRHGLHLGRRQAA